MEMEIEELRRQRDQAQTQVDELRRKLQEDQQVCVTLPLSLSHTHRFKLFQPTLRSFINSGLKAT